MCVGVKQLVLSVMLVPENLVFNMILSVILSVFASFAVVLGCLLVLSSSSSPF